MAKKNDKTPKDGSGNPGNDQDFWAQILAAAQTEAVRRVNLSDASEKTPNLTSQFTKGELLLDIYRIDSDRIDGGMGSVWKVHHTGWDTDLAMKRPQQILFANETASENFSVNFIRECRAWIELGLHPNIVTCYYVRDIGNVPTIFSEWMENGSLEDRIQDGSLYAGTENDVKARLLDIAIQYARGLHYAHEKGLIHQDVKPDNLLLTRDWDAKAADFGLAKARAQLTLLEGSMTQRDDAGVTHMAPSGGYTPAYCSMEQMDGKPLTRRTDIYSWAVSVMEMYLGSRPWSNGVVAGMGCRTYFNNVESKVQMSPELQELLAKCMAVDPDDRPHDFALIEKELCSIYRQEIGQSYPRPESKAASDTADSLNNRALSYLDMGDPEKAEVFFNKALERDPNHIDARFNRELHLVRSGQKLDYEAIEELRRYKPVRDAGLVEVLARDNGGSLDPVVRGEPRKNNYAVGYDSCYSLSDKEVFVFYNRKTKGSPELLRLDLKTGLKIGTDPMEAVRNAVEEAGVDLAQNNVAVHYIYCTHAMILPRSDQLLTVFFAKGYPDNDCHSYVYLCLYDVNKKVLTKKPVLVADLAFPADLKKPVIRPDGSQVLLHFYRSMGMSTIADHPVLVDIPSFQIRLKCEHSFICYLPENRCLFRGRNEKRQMALFVMDPDGTLREVFKFTRKIEKEVEFGDGGVPLLCYKTSNGEVFRLDENYRKIPMGQLPHNSSSVSCNPIKYDHSHGLLYLLGINHLEIWSFARADICTMPMDSGILYAGRRMAFSWDEKQRILLMCDNYKGWTFIHLPLIHPQKALWRLSHIVSVNSRIEEEDRLARLTGEFRAQFGSGDFEQAIAVYRQCCAIPGFLGSQTSFDMGMALETVAEKRKLLALRYSGHKRELPDFAVFPPYMEDEKKYIKTIRAADQYEFLENGQIALYSAKAPEKGVRFYSNDGKLISQTDLPADVRYTAVRNDRVYTVTAQLECAVLDLNGNLIRKLHDKDESLSDSDPVVVFDIDPGGNYLLYKYRYSSHPQGIYQLDLNTDSVIQLQINADPNHGNYFYHDLRYMDNETVAADHSVGWDFNTYRLQKPYTLYERFSVRTGEQLTPVKIRTDAFSSPKQKLYLSEKRDKICVYLKYHNNDRPEEIRLYDSDGELLCRKELQSLESLFIFPDSSFMAYYANKELCVFDILESEVVFTESIPEYQYLTFRPDGREIYVHYYDRPVKVYRLEFDYQLK